MDAPVEILEVLRQSGASVTVSSYRKTPLQLAASKGQVETVKWLLDNGANPEEYSTYDHLDIFQFVDQISDQYVCLIY